MCIIFIFRWPRTNEDLFDALHPASVFSGLSPQALCVRWDFSSVLVLDQPSFAKQFLHAHPSVIRGMKRYKVVSAKSLKPVGAAKAGPLQEEVSVAEALLSLQGNAAQLAKVSNYAASLLKQALEFSQAQSCGSVALDEEGSFLLSPRCLDLSPLKREGLQASFASSSL